MGASDHDHPVLILPPSPAVAVAALAEVAVVVLVVLAQGPFALLYSCYLPNLVPSDSSFSFQFKDCHKMPELETTTSGTRFKQQRATKQKTERNAACRN